jgi:DNA integrity scanning protein DisA with diadenylate cyclase activity
MHQTTDHQFSTYLCFSFKQEKMSIFSWSATQMLVDKWSFAICLQIAAHIIKCSNISEILHWLLKMMSFVLWRRIRSIVASFAFYNRALNRLSFESRSTNISDWYSISCKRRSRFSFNWLYRLFASSIILLDM